MSNLSNSVLACCVPSMVKCSLDFIAVHDVESAQCHVASALDEVDLVDIVAFDFQSNTCAALYASGELLVRDVREKRLLIERRIADAESVYVDVTGSEVVVCTRYGGVHYFDLNAACDATTSLTCEQATERETAALYRAASVCFIEGAPSCSLDGANVPVDSALQRRGCSRGRFLVGSLVGGVVFDVRASVRAVHICELLCRRLIQLPVAEPIRGLAALWVEGELPALMMSTPTHLFRTLRRDVDRGSSRRRHGLDDLLQRLRVHGSSMLHVCKVSPGCVSTEASIVSVSVCQSRVGGGVEACEGYGSLSVHRPSVSSPPFPTPGPAPAVWYTVSLFDA